MADMMGPMRISSALGILHRGADRRDLERVAGLNGELWGAHASSVPRIRRLVRQDAEHRRLEAGARPHP
jgi:hypothetical protein